MRKGKKLVATLAVCFTFGVGMFTACGKSGEVTFTLPSGAEANINAEYVPDIELGKGVSIDSIIILTPSGKRIEIKGTEGFTPDEFGIYTLTVNFRNGDNTGSGEYTLFVGDKEAPVITRKIGNKSDVEAGLYVFADDLAEVEYTDNNPAAAENAEVFAYSVKFGDEEEILLGDLKSYTFNRIGTYTVRYGVSDGSGNVSYDSYEIEIVDTVAPVLRKPAVKKLWIDDGSVAVPEILVDEITENPTVSVKVYSGSDEIPVENGKFAATENAGYRLVYTATDAAGNASAPCEINVVAVKAGLVADFTDLGESSLFVSDENVVYGGDSILIRSEASESFIELGGLDFAPYKDWKNFDYLTVTVRNRYAIDASLSAVVTANGEQVSLGSGALALASANVSGVASATETTVAFDISAVKNLSLTSLKLRFASDGKLAADVTRVGFAASADLDAAAVKAGEKTVKTVAEVLAETKTYALPYGDSFTVTDPFAACSDSVSGLSIKLYSAEGAEIRSLNAGERLSFADAECGKSYTIRYSFTDASGAAKTYDVTLVAELKGLEISVTADFMRVGSEARIPRPTLSSDVFTEAELGAADVKIYYRVLPSKVWNEGDSMTIDEASYVELCYVVTVAGNTFVKTRVEFVHSKDTYMDFETSEGYEHYGFGRERRTEGHVAPSDEWSKDGKYSVKFTGTQYHDFLGIDYYGGYEYDFATPVDVISMWIYAPVPLAEREVRVDIGNETWVAAEPFTVLEGEHLYTLKLTQPVTRVESLAFVTYPVETFYVDAVRFFAFYEIGDVEIPSKAYFDEGLSVTRPSVSSSFYTDEELENAYKVGYRLEGTEEYTFVTESDGKFDIDFPEIGTYEIIYGVKVDDNEKFETATVKVVYYDVEIGFNRTAFEKGDAFTLPIPVIGSGITYRTFVSAGADFNEINGSYAFTDYGTYTFRYVFDKAGRTQTYDYKVVVRESGVILDGETDADGKVSIGTGNVRLSRDAYDGTYSVEFIKDRTWWCDMTLDEAFTGKFDTIVFRAKASGAFSDGTSSGLRLFDSAGRYDEYSLNIGTEWAYYEIAVPANSTITDVKRIVFRNDDAASVFVDGMRLIDTAVYIDATVADDLQVNVEKEIAVTLTSAYYSDSDLSGATVTARYKKQGDEWSDIAVANGKIKFTASEKCTYVFEISVKIGEKTFTDEFELDAILFPCSIGSFATAMNAGETLALPAPIVDSAATTVISYKEKSATAWTTLDGNDFTIGTAGNYEIKYTVTLNGLEQTFVYPFVVRESGVIIDGETDLNGNVSIGSGANVRLSSDAYDGKYSVEFVKDPAWWCSMSYAYSGAEYDTITFYAKANGTFGGGIRIFTGANDYTERDLSFTTEWTKYTIKMNAAVNSIVKIQILNCDAYSVFVDSMRLIDTRFYVSADYEGEVKALEDKEISVSLSSGYYTDEQLASATLTAKYRKAGGEWSDIAVNNGKIVFNAATDGEYELAISATLDGKTVTETITVNVQLFAVTIGSFATAMNVGETLALPAPIVDSAATTVISYKEKSANAWTTLDGNDFTIGTAGNYEIKYTITLNELEQTFVYPFVVRESGVIIDGETDLNGNVSIGSGANVRLSTDAYDGKYSVEFVKDPTWWCKMSYAYSGAEYDTITFYAKANGTFGGGIRIFTGANDYIERDLSFTTEWTKYTIKMNAAVNSIVEIQILNCDAYSVFVDSMRLIDTRFYVSADYEGEVKALEDKEINVSLSSGYYTDSQLASATLTAKYRKTGGEWSDIAVNNGKIVFNAATDGEYELAISATLDGKTVTTTLKLTVQLFPCSIGAFATAMNVGETLTLPAPTVDSAAITVISYCAKGSDSYTAVEGNAVTIQSAGRYVIRYEVTLGGVTQTFDFDIVVRGAGVIIDGETDLSGKVSIGSGNVRLSSDAYDGKYSVEFVKDPVWWCNMELSEVYTGDFNTITFWAKSDKEMNNNAGIRIEGSNGVSFAFQGEDEGVAKFGTEWKFYTITLTAEQVEQLGDVKKIGILNCDEVSVFVDSMTLSKV